jgi:pyruvate/2-oxoglutarate dehydrogenase complex dihydrolipoamide dehydrogenase (E3) component
MKYDAIVIGSGQSGSPLAAALADLGWKVAIVEKSYLGGTCINTGCTPTKTMVQRALVAHYARNAARWGVIARDVSVDLPKILAQKDKVVLHSRQGQEKRISTRPNLHLYRGHARFTAPHQITVDGATHESEKIFIDAGARPRIPDIPGLATSGYLTNESIIELETLPDHLIILGAGYIGLEFGQMFARFGSRVTIIHDADQIVPHEDPEVSSELQKALESEGVNFLFNAKTTEVARAGDTIVLSLEVTAADALGAKKTSTGSLTGSHLLAATGRIPNTDDLGLDRAGIETDARGFIKVNGRLETSVPGIWATGDIKGGPAFTHLSYNDYQIVYANIVEKKDLSIDHRIVPYCVYTDPELGRVGLTEKEARAQGYKLKIGSVPMSQVSRAIERDETAGLMKLVVDAANDQILGATFLGANGGEVIHIPYTLMLGRLPYTLLKGGVYIHPTMAEGLFFLMDAVKPVD